MNIHWASRTICPLVTINFLLLSQHSYHFQTQKPKAIVDYSSALAVLEWLFHWRFFTFILCLLFFLFPLKGECHGQDSSPGLCTHLDTVLLPPWRSLCLILEGKPFQLGFVGTHSHSRVNDSSAARKTVLKVPGGITGTQTQAVAMGCTGHGIWDLR